MKRIMKAIPRLRKKMVTIVLTCLILSIFKGASSIFLEVFVDNT